MDELAQELIDHFIDCWNVADKDAMSSCGLVCKRWLPRSRYHLFSQVSLNAKNLDSFVHLVESSPRPILSYIRHLILVFLGSPLDTTHLARLHPCQNLTSIKLFLPFQLIETIEALRWLSSEEDLRTHLRSWHDRSVCFSSLAFGTIRLLEMPLHTITDLISCVPRITTLKISGISISTGSLGTTNCPHPSRLDHLGLSLYRGGFPRVFSWLLSLPAIPILRSLTLHEMLGPDDQVDEDWTPITAYLQQVGDGLLSLQLAFLTTQGCLNFQRYMLPYTPNLRNLTLIVNLPSDVLDTILLLRTSHSWDSIFVHINPVAAGDELWSALDAALAEPHFRTLKRFSIDFFTWHLPQPDAPSIIPQPRLLMPLANARGILD